MQDAKIQHRFQTGFSLIEIAVVLTILGILLGGLLSASSGLIRHQQIRQVENELQLIHDALLGFSIQHGRLPCPDTDQDGSENIGADGTCSTNAGNLPAVDLAVQQRDRWGNDYRYHVDTDFADLPAVDQQSSFGLDDVGNLRVRNTTGANAANVAIELPVIIFSIGANGNNNLSADEQENINADNTFVLRDYSTAPGNEFDDILIWLSPYILKSRMLDAGRLP